MTERQNKQHEQNIFIESHAEDEISSLMTLFDVQEKHQQALIESGFIRRFAEALETNAPLGTLGRVLVEQQFSKTDTDTPYRTLYAVFEHGDNETMTTLRHAIGEELGGVFMTEEPFTHQDMLLALDQMNDLQPFIENGILERRLSVAVAAK